MGKIKILMVLGNTKMGGTQAFILNLLRNIDHERFQIDIAVNNEVENGIGDDFRSLGCEIYFWPYFKVYNYFSFVSFWKKFLMEHSYDIVHAHSTNSASVYLKIAKVAGCVTIAHSHSAGYRGGRGQQFIKRFFATKVRQVADYWFACSDKAAERLYGQDYLTYPHYYAIPNAINAEIYLYDSDTSQKIRKAISVDDNAFLCGHVGTFSEPKNHIFLMDIFSEVLKIKPEARLVCCGAGDLMPAVKEKAKALGILDKVVFPGVVKNCNEFMMAMDVFVFPSIFEGFPVSVIEAEATGTQVVMSDVITSEVDLTPVIHRMSLNDSPAEWAIKICELDAEERGKYNKVIVNSKYNMRTSISQISSLYEEMTNLK